MALTFVMPLSAVPMSCTATLRACLCSLQSLTLNLPAHSWGAGPAHTAAPWPLGAGLQEEGVNGLPHFYAHPRITFLLCAFSHNACNFESRQGKTSWGSIWNVRPGSRRRPQAKSSSGPFFGF